MRESSSSIEAIVLAIGVLGATIPAVAQEPARPTASPSEANPAVPAPGHSVHGKAFNDGPRPQG
ncbi:MAG TPA: hypothetical protein VKF17_03605 [Isosphaeraceae bacterium]|nr:hypothetical protein [Isosphaeraceae bacterium]